MKLIVLSDNNALNESLQSEHGLSVYVETSNYKCLLDTGASDIFIQNAAKMHVDLKSIDYVIISHGHADHIGGLSAFLNINSKAKIILSRHILNQTYYSKRLGLRKISVDLDVAHFADRFIFIDDEDFKEYDMHVFKVNELVYPLPKANCNLFKDAGNGLEPDNFNHELIITFGTKDLFVFTGCCHNGLLNILKSIPLNARQNIRYVMGGFHLLDSSVHQSYESEAEILALSQILHSHFPLTDFITGHCTGEHAYNTMKKVLECRLRHFFTGFTLEI